MYNSGVKHRAGACAHLDPLECVLKKKAAECTDIYGVVLGLSKSVPSFIMLKFAGWVFVITQLTC